MIRQANRSIQAAIESQTPDIILTPEEKAQIYNLNLDLAQAQNQELSEAFTLFLTIYNQSTPPLSPSAQDLITKKIPPLKPISSQSYTNYHQELRETYRLLQKGKIVEAAYVKSIIDRALPHLKRNKAKLLPLFTSMATTEPEKPHWQFTFPEQDW